MTAINPNRVAFDLPMRGGGKEKHKPHPESAFMPGSVYALLRS